MIICNERNDGAVYADHMLNFMKNFVTGYHGEGNINNIISSGYGIHRKYSSFDSVGRESGKQYS